MMYRRVLPGYIHLHKVRTLNNLKSDNRTFECTTNIDQFEKCSQWPQKPVPKTHKISYFKNLFISFSNPIQGNFFPPEY